MTDLGAWLNFISPDGPCFDSALNPIPGPGTSLCMIDSMMEYYLQRSRTLPIRVLEIGSYAGTSAITFGNALQRCGVENYTIYCCDKWHHFNTIQFQPGYTRIGSSRTVFNHSVFRHNISKSIGWDHGVEVIGDSATSLSGLRDGWFDLVYVDGFHGYTQTLGDIRAALRLCRSDGIICGADLDCDLVDVATLSEDELEQDEQIIDGRHMHGGVVLAVHEVLGAPRPFGSFWAFERADLRPIDCSALPRRVPTFLPEPWRGRIEAMLREI